MVETVLGIETVPVNDVSSALITAADQSKSCNDLVIAVIL